MTDRNGIDARHAARLTFVTALLATLLVAGCGQETPQELQMQGMRKAVSGDHAGALVDLDRAVALQPNDPALLMVRAGLHDEAGNPAAAVADYEKVIAIAPHFEPGLAAQLESLRKRAGLTVPTPAPAPSATHVADEETSHAPGPTITQVAFCATEPGGYRDYREQPDARYRAGETVWIYLDVVDLGVRRRDDARLENVVRQSLQLRDPSGAVLMREVVLDGARPVASGEDAGRMFLRNRLPIPAGAAPGEYTVDFVLEDRVAGATAEAGGQFVITR